MKKMRLCAVLTALLLALSLAACGDKKTETVLTGFDVQAEVTVSYGEYYTVPSVIAKDADGNSYVASASVTCDGQEVLVLGGRFQITSMQDYVVTYTIKVGEETFEKKSVLKVADTGKPVVTLELAKTTYVVGDAFTLPEATAADTVDSAPTVRVELRYNGQTVPVTDGFTFTQAGRYEVYASATDAAGNVGEASVSIGVRGPAAENEIEAFTDEYGSFAGVWNENGEALQFGYADDAMDGYVEDDIIAYVSSKTASGGIAAYPGFTLEPRISKEAAAGYSGIRIRFMQNSTVNRSLYSKWDGKQINYGSYTPNVWHEVTLSGGGKTSAEIVQLFIDNYDEIASGSVLLFYTGNEASYIKQEEFTLYIASIDLVRAADISFADGLADTKFEPNDQLTFAELGLSASYGGTAVSGAAFTVTVTDPDNNETAMTDTYTFEEAGAYTVKASIATEPYTGSAEIRLTVEAGLDHVNSLVAQLKAASDKESAAFCADVVKLRNAYDTLSADNKAELTLEDMVKEIFGETVFEEDKAWYYDSPIALLTHAAKQTNGGNSTINNQIVPFSGTAELFAEDEYSGLKLTTTERTYFTLLSLENMFERLGSIDGYEALTFSVRLNSPSTAQSGDKFGIRLLNGAYRTAAGSEHLLAIVSDPYSGNLAYGSWHDITIPLGGFDSWDKAYIGFYGSRWSEIDAGIEIYVTAAQLQPTSELSVAVNLTDPRVDDQLKTSDVTVTATYKNQPVAYTLTAAAGETAGGGTVLTTDSPITLTAGVWTVRATITEGALKDTYAEAQFTVREKSSITAENINSRVAELLAEADKASDEYKAKVAQLQTDYATMPEAEKPNVHYVEYLCAVQGRGAPAANVLIEFGAALGLDQVQYNVTFANETVIDYVGTAAYTTDVPAGLDAAYGTGATKFALDPDTKFYQLMLDVKHVAATLGDISEYDSISFYVYRDSTAKFLVRGRSLSDYNSSTTVSSLAGQTWQKVTIPLAKFTDWDDIRIWLVDNSWNPVNGTTWYVSNILAEPAAAEPEA